MGRLSGSLARYRLRLVAGIACLVGATSLTMMVPWLFRSVVDGIAAGRPLAALAPTLALIVGIASLQAVVRTLPRFMIFNVGPHLQDDLRHGPFTHLGTLPPRFSHPWRTRAPQSRP